MNQPALGFLGLGTMGGPMCGRLLQAGFAVTICEPDDARAQVLVEAGAARAMTPRQVADHAEVVFACLPSREISREAALGDNGVVHGQAIRIYVETSTLGRPDIEALVEGLAPRRIAVVDAPISGGAAPARAGTLSILLAGPRQACQEIRPALDAMASNVFDFGEAAGRAQVAKLINNLLSSAGLVTAIEGVVMGVKAGLDAQTLIEAINVSTGRNSATLEKFPKAILPRTFTFGGPLTIGLKDMELFLEEAQRQGTPLWVAPRVMALFREAAEHGFKEKDFMRLVEYVESLTDGVVVRGRDAP